MKFSFFECYHFNQPNKREIFHSFFNFNVSLVRYSKLCDIMLLRSDTIKKPSLICDNNRIDFHACQSLSRRLTPRTESCESNVTSRNVSILPKKSTTLSLYGYVGEDVTHPFSSAIKITTIMILNKVYGSTFMMF